MLEKWALHEHNVGMMGSIWLLYLRELHLSLNPHC